jgi:uncharacterized protein (DUF433 family)
MASLDWSQCPAVESIPGKVSGAWVFRDTRLPVATIIENLEDLSVEEVVEQFPVTREQIRAVLEFVAESLKAPALAPVVQLEELPRKSKKSAYGLLAKYGPGPTAEEIDENRREMFNGFGELAP